MPENTWSVLSSFASVTLHRLEPVPTSSRRLLVSDMGSGRVRQEFPQFNGFRRFPKQRDSRLVIQVVERPFLWLLVHGDVGHTQGRTL